jgi:hypothetical protein
MADKDNNDFNLDDDDDQQGDQQQGKKGGESKQRKKYNAALNGLTRILGGQFLYKPTSLVPSEVQAAIIEMAKEEKEKFVKEFKADAIALIQEKRDHDKHVVKLFAEAKQKEEQNMVGFIEKAKKLFAKVKDIQDIEQSYYDTLMGAAEGKSAQTGPAKVDSVK